MEKEYTEKSYFDGTLLQFIGKSILAALITILSLGIAVPWAVCLIYDWETKQCSALGFRLYAGL